MGFIPDKDKEMLQKLFESRITQKIPIKFFFDEKKKCQYCKETGEILDELASLCSNLIIEKYDIEKDREYADELAIEMTPAIVLGPENNIRFFGIPAGYEFTSLIEDIMDIAGSLEHGPHVHWPENMIEDVKKIDEHLHIQVFVTVACPYCPKAVRFAHKLALLNSNITADMIESAEFPELAKHFNVSGVPKTIINHGSAEFTGMYPDDKALEEVLGAIKKK